MNKPETLTAEQMRAAAMIASGYSQSEVARFIGKSKGSISKWMKKPEFIERVKEVRSSVNSVQTRITDEVITKNEKDFRESLSRYKDSKQLAYRQLVNQGLTLCSKVLERTKDLKPEEIKINNIAPLVNATATLLGDGFRNWDEYLKINYYKRNQFKELDSVMELVESGVFSLEAQRKINQAFLECQDKVLAIVASDHQIKSDDSIKTINVA